MDSAPIDGARPRAESETGLLLGMGVAALALGRAIQLNNGHYRVDSLVWIGVALAAMLGALAAPRGAWTPSKRSAQRIENGVVLLLAIGVTAQLAQLLTRPPGIYLKPEAMSIDLFRAGIVSAAVVVGSIASRAGWLGRMGVPLLLAIHLLCGIWIVKATPEPFIDVFYWYNEAFEVLRDGGNPYAHDMPDIYRGGRTRVAGEWVFAHRVDVGFSYPPLNLAAALPGYLLGDVRYASIVAATVAGGLLAYARPGRIAALAAAMLLFTPRAFFVYEQAWTEALVVPFLAATLFCWARWPRALPYAFGLLCAMKPYLFILPVFAPLLLPRPLRWRALWSFQWRAAAVAAPLVLLPALFSPEAYWHSVFELQLDRRLRMDSLSFLVHWVKLGHENPGAWPGFAALAVATPLALWRLPRSAAGFAAGVAFVFLTFFAFNKLAFCNYYYFVIGAAAGAVATAAPREERVGSAGARRRSDDSDDRPAV